MTPRRPPVSRPEKVSGDVVQAVLDLERLSQWDLGRRLGASQSQVSRWIEGKSRVPALVAHILSCPACYSHYVQRSALQLLDR